jgi:DNA-directed RNA polymerase specialized sigma24 family protein
MSSQNDVLANGVKPALTAGGLKSTARVEETKPARRRRRSDVENDDFARFAVRIIRAHGRRIAEGDVEGLVELLALSEELASATQVAVNGLRGHGFSWGEIASRLGTSRQAAQQRWGRA